MPKRANELNQLEKEEYHRRMEESSSSVDAQVPFARASQAQLQNRRIVRVTRPPPASSSGGGRGVFSNINLAAPQAPAVAATTGSAAAPSFSFGNTTATSSTTTAGVGTATTAASNNNSGTGTGAGNPAISSDVQEKTNQLFASLRSKVFKMVSDPQHGKESWSIIFSNVLQAQHMLAKNHMQQQQQTNNTNGAPPPQQPSFSFGSSSNNNNATTVTAAAAAPFSFGAPSVAAPVPASGGFSFGAPPTAAAPTGGGFSFSSSTTSSQGTSSSTINMGGSSTGGGGFTFGKPPAAAAAAAPPPSAAGSNPFSTTSDSAADDDAPIKDDEPSVQPAANDPEWAEVGKFQPINAFRLKDKEKAESGFVCFASKGLLRLQKSTMTGSNKTRVLMRDDAGIRVVVNMLLEPGCGLTQEFTTRNKKEFSCISFFGDNGRGHELIRIKSRAELGRELFTALNDAISGGGL